MGNKNLWISHDCKKGKRPVEYKTRVDVMDVDEMKSSNQEAGRLEWGSDRDDPGNDILAYRICSDKTATITCPNCDEEIDLAVKEGE